jgi:hypothetical protein
MKDLSQHPLRHFRLLLLVVALVWLSGCSSVNQNGGTPLDADALYQDNFTPGSIGPWLFEADELGRTAVINDELIIAINAPNTMQYTMLSEPTFSDFLLEVDARQIAGDLESSFGFLVRMQDTEQFYRFSITGNGLYMVERRAAGGAWTQYPLDWISTPAINQGVNASNRLKLVADGAKLSFYVNDVLLHQLDDALYPSGHIALNAGTFGQPGLQVAFDNLIVRGLR